MASVTLVEDPAPASTTPEESKSCPICYDEIEFPNAYTAGTCRHVFHKTCMDTWLKVNRSCPVCRVYVPLFSSLSTDNQQKFINVFVHAGGITELNSVQAATLRQILMDELLPVEVLRFCDNLPLRLAASCGDVILVSLLLWRGLTVADIRFNRNSALRRAVINGHLEVVQFFFQIHRLLYTDIVLDNILDEAIFQDRLQITHFLIHEGLTIVYLRKHAQRFLMFTIIHKKMPMFQVLMSNLEAEDLRSDINSILCTAITHNATAMVRLLLEKLTPNDLRSDKYHALRLADALRRAQALGHTEVARILRRFIAAHIY